MNMLTGMIPPTSGSALVDGKSIQTQMPEIRKSLGYCPQYDIVYPSLTVAEHMIFFSWLKGINKKELNSHCVEMFEGLNLHDLKQQDYSAGNMSTGTLGVYVRRSHVQ